jgi:hypothetical protein
MACTQDRAVRPAAPPVEQAVLRPIVRSADARRLRLQGACRVSHGLRSPGAPHRLPGELGGTHGFPGTPDRLPQHRSTFCKVAELDLVLRPHGQGVPLRPPLKPVRSAAADRGARAADRYGRFFGGDQKRASRCLVASKTIRPFFAALVRALYA